MRRCSEARHQLLGLLLGLLVLSPAAGAERCEDATSGKQIFWGDLHVHSGYSLDAWGYGTAASPAEIYAFAKGGKLTLADGSKAALARPLDFMAVTDHAEWFDLMHLCTDPQRIDHPYCTTLTTQNTPQAGGQVFAEYVLPTITKAAPEPTALCAEDPTRCASAHTAQWQRIQAQAHAAYEPCRFTTFAAYEWSATPDYSHNHRNIVFASEAVTFDAVDYLRYPTPEALWRALDRQCRPGDGCDVLAIPHNTNMGDGKSFDIETEAAEVLALRERYERLVEIHQEKGNSECLPAFGHTDEDCSFERYLTRNSQAAVPKDYTEAEWQRMRSGYVRGLLLRGLAGYQRTGQNALALGIIGSTDNHTGTGGFVDEETWPGTAFGLGDFDRAMVRRDWNPGGILAVWAEQNTREAVFAALKRREVYATSGPRIRLRVAASNRPLTCDAGARADAGGTVAMGGQLRGEAAHLKINVQADGTPISEVQIVRGSLRAGKPTEHVVSVWRNAEGAVDVCTTWQDGNFDAAAPAFWYARVLEVPTPRWSAYRCRKAGRCDEFPGADRWIRERAWSSPIWFYPLADG